MFCSGSRKLKNTLTISENCCKMPYNKKYERRKNRQEKN